MSQPQVATLDDVAELQQALLQSPRIALDTEFHAERRWLPVLYLVQIALPDGSVWVLDPLIDGLLTAVSDALCHPRWVVHSGTTDLKLMRRALGQLPQVVDDTQLAAGLVDIAYPASLADLVACWGDGALDKSSTLSDWSQRPLSSEQLRYAAEDVEVLLPLWDALNAELRSLDRVEVARAACDEALAAATDDLDPGHAWRNISAVPALDPQALPVLRALTTWREREARARNQPTRTVVGDGVLVELAKRRPATEQVLNSNRRLPKTIARNATTILELIASAASTPAETWPRAVRRRTPQARALALLQVHADVLGHDDRWGTRLVTPKSTLEDLVLASPQTRAQVRALLGEWRDQVAGDSLWRAWTGRESLRLHQGRATRVPDAPPS